MHYSSQLYSVTLVIKPQHPTFLNRSAPVEKPALLNCIILHNFCHVTFIIAALFPSQVWGLVQFHSSICSNIRATSRIFGQMMMPLEMLLESRRYVSYFSELVINKFQPIWFVCMLIILPTQGSLGEWVRCHSPGLPSTNRDIKNSIKYHRNVTLKGYRSLVYR